MAKSTVAVVVTTCDYGRYLEDCLRSIDRQTRRPDQIVVIDDASTDDTSRVLESVIPQLGSRALIQVLRNDARLGVAGSTNRAIAATDTTYVAHVDADDTVQDRYLEAMFDVLARNPRAGYAYPRLRLFGDESGLMATYPFDPARLVFEGNYIASIALMRRSAFDQTPGFRDLATHVDWDLWLSFLEAGWPGVLVDEVLYNWRRHGRTKTHQSPLQRLLIRGRLQWDHRALIAAYRSEAARWTGRAISRRLLPSGAGGGAKLGRSGWVEPDSSSDEPDKR